MNPSYWEQVKELFGSALERPEGLRRKFIYENCADPAIRSEIESLLGSLVAAGSFIDDAPVVKIGDMFESRNTALEAGQILGRYRIIEPIGSGGMGEVYLAEDGDLYRKVAVKVFSETIAADPLNLRRFRQEALAVSALNHPNILTIFEIGEDGGRKFIVTEHVAGTPLRDLIGTLPLREALEIGSQIASALDAAHRGGVVHRDIKPDNIIVRQDGLVKVLDFGLAKLAPSASEDPGGDAATRLFVDTVPGMIMGTAAYMSPEQARGRAVDHRTDIWSLGVVLYEMLTGQVPFGGETFSHAVVAILENEPPPLSESIDGFSSQLERIIRKALAKQPERRYASAIEFAADLKAVIRELDLGEASEGHQEPEGRSPARKNRDHFAVVSGSGSGECPDSRQELIGRDTEITEVAELLSRPEIRLVTLTGIGGTGKTSLARAVTARLQKAYPDGAVLIELSTVTDADLVISVIAQKLDVPETGETPIIETLVDHISQREMLLTLDNFEHVVDSAPAVAELIAGVPGLKILVTSRERLHLTFEAEFPVPPLPLPPEERELPPEELRRFESVRLFERRARAANPDFILTDENIVAVAKICSCLDGLPLAIELAAARARLLTPQAILAKLDDKLSLLTGGARDLPARQRTMRGAIEWSYDLLSDDEKRLFRRLSVFACGFTPSYAEEITADAQTASRSDPGQSIEFFDLFASLSDKSLLVPRGHLDGERRFGLLEIVREFAAAELEASGETDEFRRRHAQRFLALAEQGEPHLKGADSAEWLRRLETEHDNLSAALHWSLEHDPPIAARLGAAIRHLWIIHGHLNEGRRWADEILGREIEMSPDVRWKLVTGSGNMAQFQGDVERARTLYSQGLAISRESGNRAQIAQSLRGLGALAYMDGDFAAAREMIEEAIVISRDAGDKFGLGASLARFGDIAAADGDFETALALSGQALAIFRELGYTEGISAKLNNLGATAFLMGEHEDARAYFDEALATALSLGEKINTRLIFDGYAALATQAGDYVRAAKLSGVAETLGASIGYAVEPAEQLFRDLYIGKLRAAMNDEEFSAARESGRELTLEQATTLTE
jgi:non-specific serine/threonine protein kinase